MAQLDDGSADPSTSLGYVPAPRHRGRYAGKELPLRPNAVGSIGELRGKPALQRALERKHASPTEQLEGPLVLLRRLGGFAGTQIEISQAVVGDGEEIRSVHGAGLVAGDASVEETALELLVQLVGAGDVVARQPPTLRIPTAQEDLPQLGDAALRLSQLDLDDAQIAEGPVLELLVAMLVGPLPSSGEEGQGFVPLAVAGQADTLLSKLLVHDRRRSGLTRVAW